jgi:hypothetical protein
MRFRSLTSVTMKNSVFWVVTPCSLVEVYRCFGINHCLHLCDGRVWVVPMWRRVLSKTEARGKLLVATHLADVILQKTLFLRVTVG